MRSVVTAALLGVALLASREAVAADRVAVLPFVASGGGTTSGELATTRAATRDAVVRILDELPSDAEVASAEREVKDGVADTSAEYRAAGRVARAQWTVVGHVDVHGPTYRLEIDACQVATGRVESLAREVDPKKATAQIAEMLALLVRPQGVGDAVPPWDQASTPAPAPTHAPVAPTPAPPPPPLSPPAAYAENHPFAVGLGAAVDTAFSRASSAPNSTVAPVAGHLTADAAYALGALRGLELVANASLAVAGPGSLSVDGGIRYELPIFRRARIFAGPELAIGAFFDLGGDKDARFLMSAALPIVIGLGERLQIEAYPQIAYAAGGTVSLAFASGGLRAVLRF